MRYRTLLTLTWLLALPVSAIDIGPMTAVLESTDEFMARTITNNSISPKIYEVRVTKISNPTTSGQLLAMPPGELLYAPKSFVLHSKQQQNVKFYYNGIADDQERYYRVTFIESPAAQAGGHEDKSRKSKLDIKIELQSILVARPRQGRFEYRLDQMDGSITNIGNTYFEFMVKEGCDQPDRVADNKYLLPGETYRNTKISQPGNQKLIVYQSRFIPVGKDC
ncbi:hypothetical protein D3C73_660730 [compost metagenome]